MTKTKKIYCQIRKAVKFTVGFFALITAFAAFWVQFGFPLPASAEDVNKLTKGQANIGIKVQLQIEKDLRRELFDLRWKLRGLQAKAGKTITPKDKDFERYLEQQIMELEALEKRERNQRQSYKEQLQRLERK